MTEAREKTIVEENIAALKERAGRLQAMYMSSINMTHHFYEQLKEVEDEIVKRNLSRLKRRSKK